MAGQTTDSWTRAFTRAAHTVAITEQGDQGERPGDQRHRGRPASGSDRGQR
jgi:hypothetical protein